MERNTCHHTTTLWIFISNYLIIPLKARKLVKVSALYQQYISYLIIITTKLPIILGFSWMHLHDTQISWFNKGSTRWSCHCMNHCLHIPHLLMTSTIVESPEIQQTFPQDIVNSKKISVKIKPKLWATTVPHI